jgi:hypothetical protein
VDVGIVIIGTSETSEVLITGAGVDVGIVIIGTSETSELVEQARTLISTILTKRTFSLYKLFLPIILIFN